MTMCAGGGKGSGMEDKRRRPCRSRIAAALLASLVLLAGACARRETKSEGSAPPPDTLPPAALTERAERDSVRVAKLVVAYYRYLSRKDPDGADQLFFPESIRVGTPDGAILVEGLSTEIRRRIEDEMLKAKPVRRIVLLRKSGRELLESTFRETWLLRFVPDGPDSAVVERRIHVIQQLGSDTRWLGRMDVAP